jgi:hypothetical protein
MIQKELNTNIAEGGEPAELATMLKNKSGNPYICLAILYGLKFEIVNGVITENFYQWRERVTGIKHFLPQALSSVIFGAGYGGAFQAGIDETMFEHLIKVVNDSGILNDVKAITTDNKKVLGTFKFYVRPTISSLGVKNPFDFSGTPIRQIHNLIHSGGGMAPFGKNAILPHHYGSEVMTGGGENELPFSKLMRDTFNKAIEQLGTRGFKLGENSSKKIDDSIKAMENAEKEYINEMKELAEFTKDVKSSGMEGQQEEFEFEKMKKIEESIKKMNKEQQRLVHPLFKMLTVVSEPVSSDRERAKEFEKQVNLHRKHSISPFLQ